MIKSLLKKQLMEAFSWLYVSRKTGVRKSKAGIIGTALLYVFLFAYLGVIFYFVGNFLCEPLVSVGYTWLYFTLMGLIAVILGVVGSVFSSSAAIYHPKDNDILLSMPIPTDIILPVRLVGVWFMGLLYSLPVTVPTVAVYLIKASLNASAVVFTLLIPLLLSVLILALSALLGYFVALISAKVKSKNYITVVLSLAFIFAYYYLYTKIINAIQNLVAHPETSDKIKGVLFPFYHMGLAAEGKTASMLIFTAVTLAVFLLVYLLMQRSFLKLATANRGENETKYKAKEAKSGSVSSALVKKEFRRFLSSSVYMLNCGLGIPLTLVACVALIIKAKDVRMLASVVGIDRDMLTLVAAAAVCMISSMNDMTAPSVSLEGKELWILKVYPVDASKVLLAKLKFHLIMAIPSSLIASVCISAVLNVGIVSGVLLAALGTVFVILCGIIGLISNILFPNFNWTNEVVPVKQSISVVIGLFLPWIIVTLAGVAYWKVFASTAPLLYLGICTAIFALLSAAGLWWTVTKGKRRFEVLS